jgi:DNA-binding CsgD family transcriptional regulator
VSQTKLVELLSGARQEVLSTTTGIPPQLSAGLAEAMRTGQCPSDVRVRLLCSPPGGDGRGRLREAFRHGAQVKITKIRLQEALVIDRRLAVVAAAHGGRGLLVVTAPAAIATMAESFGPCWAAATPWAPASEQPDEFERSILQRLVSGLTDDAVAHQLGVSARTVRRYVNMLMARVGARSRFELGFRAAEFGWLENLHERILAGHTPGDFGDFSRAAPVG